MVFITTLSTILSGVIVFIISQLFIEFYLKPIQDFKKLKSKVLYTLSYYSKVYSNVESEPICNLESVLEAEIQLSELACIVEAFSEMRPKYNKSIPHSDDLRKCGQEIRSISNRCRSPKNSTYDYILLNVKSSKRAKQLLKIKE